MNAPSGMRTPSADMASRIGLGSPRRKWRRRLIWLAVILLVIGGIAIYVLSSAKKTEYVTAPVSRGPMAITVTATGTLAPRNQVDVGAEVSGKIDSIAVDYNDHVTKGEVLAQINTEQLKAQLAQAEATLAQNQATVEQNHLTFERYSALMNTKAISAQSMAQAKADLDRARANVALAQAVVDYDKTLLGKTTIISPIDGVVLDRKVSVGQTVTAGFTTPVLFTLASDLSEMELDVDIDEADVGAVRTGDKASFTVDAYPTRSFPAKLTLVHSASQTVQNVVTYKGILIVGNAEHLLRPGMTATATIIADKIEGALQIPNAALRYLAPQDIRDKNTPPSGEANTGRVWTVSGKTLKPHDLTIGLSDGHMTQVLKSDLKPGESVVTDVKTDTTAQQ